MFGRKKDMENQVRNANKTLEGYTAIEYRLGPCPEGPGICLYCHKPFLDGEEWQRHTSPTDPDYGSYQVGIHRRCLDGK